MTGYRSFRSRPRDRLSRDALFRLFRAVSSEPQCLPSLRSSPSRTAKHDSRIRYPVLNNVPSTERILSARNQTSTHTPRTMAMESVAAAAWSPFIVVAALATPLLLLPLLLRLGVWAVARRGCLCSSPHATRDDVLRDALEGWRTVALQRVQRRVRRQQHHTKRTAPSQETDQQMPPQRDVFRRRTSMSSHRGADWNKWLPSPAPFRSFPAVTDETHRRLMSEVEAGTANGAGRFYAEVVRRHEEHAWGICPSPPRCPGTPLMIDE